MSLYKYYKYAVILPSAVTIAGYLLYTIIDLSFGPKYTSEWVTANSMGAFAMMLLMINCMCICLLSLTLFFNNYMQVRKNFFLSAACWLLLPAIWISILLYGEINQLNEENGLVNEGSLFVLVNTLPFAMGLTLTFIRFRMRYSRDVRSAGKI
ncbi:hypothetical protein ACTJJ0_21230 [Chitinophaga sp. 22321]|uniref:Uncharacterized protein n=1 Tax=Chitinophaga hostae TaxID=2831022 RepID=A0ABS5J467_9BACT|nr:hypothetical protein [Chitinophaga hostae]MBS0030011.1 hypothetical protein [Chitinophaga hostae]